jgi:hypothetical protein
MTFAANPPIEIPLERLTGQQKWELFQTLWDDITEHHEEALEPQDWHFDILQEREERIARGEATWIPIEDAIKRLEAKYS